MTYTSVYKNKKTHVLSIAVHMASISIRLKFQSVLTVGMNKATSSPHRCQEKARYLSKLHLVHKYVFKKNASLVLPDNF